MKDIQERFNIKKNSNIINIVLIVIVFSLLSSAITGITIYFLNNKNVLLSENEKELLDTFKSINDKYYKDIDINKVKDAAIDGMMDYLNEDYSELLNDYESNSLLDKLNGQYKGIGVSIGVIDDKVTIMEVRDDTPAKRADIRTGDIILGINNIKIGTDNFSNITSIVENSESITLELKRDKEVLKKNVDVATIIKPSISSSIIDELDKKIGYIYIETFSNTTDSQFKSNLELLESKGIDSLIIDVRDNTGGYLEIAKSIASLFIIKDKPIYQYKSKDSYEIVYDRTDESRNYDIVVLINERTASASEILALALKESYGAILIGETSYGKGSVQQLGVLNNKENIKITVAKWYSPNGNSIDEIGILPGIYVKNDSMNIDKQLKKALEVLTN